MRMGGLSQNCVGDNCLNRRWMALKICKHVLFCDCVEYCLCVDSVYKVRLHCMQQCAAADPYHANEISTAIKSVYYIQLTESRQINLWYLTFSFCTEQHSGIYDWKQQCPLYFTEQGWQICVGFVCRGSATKVCLLWNSIQHWPKRDEPMPYSGAIIVSMGTPQLPMETQQRNSFPNPAKSA